MGIFMLQGFNEAGFIALFDFTQFIGFYFKLFVFTLFLFNFIRLYLVLMMMIIIRLGKMMSKFCRAMT